ncbi:protein-glutamine glutaminase family protein [Flavobacterium sp. GSB-24]|uniref:protein-glutamine glutaminase family protein n=1 Tax=Flavobacterium sp. GSB-24 TaxID=2994319 RepID=UPI0024917A12|nr:protein-glutamine glutaminase family protein [Flavobacterium sp. GSB-24]BDU25181.1 hypothetical protein FLGSB24_19250 [Flavobacterium sp. GSB-24]
MAIQLIYNDGLQIFSEACKMANQILSSPEFFQLIASRTKSFRETIPADLEPSKIAKLFEESNLVLTLTHYERPSSVGGAYSKTYPNQIFVNTNTNRSGCTYAAVLVHECVHALSHHTKDIDFTHDNDKPEKNQDTAPYAIQKAVRKYFCGESLVDEKSLILVETKVNSDDFTRLNTADTDSRADNSRTYKNLNNNDSNLITINGKDYNTELYSIASLNENNNFINIAFFENPTHFKLAKSSKDFAEKINLLELAHQNALKLEIVYQINTEEIVEVNKAPMQLTSLSYYKDNRFLPQVKKDLKHSIENHDKLNDIFNFIVLQSCKSTQQSISPCIPFHYKKDGCYARAHKMRYIIEEIYGYNSEKIFSYDSVTPRNNDAVYKLAVKDGLTCIYWWYHVAPLVKVQENDQIKEYVIDPSIAESPLTKEEWVNSQEEKFCSLNSRVGSTEIRPSYIYFPNGALDENYENTDRTLRKYSRS